MTSAEAVNWAMGEILKTPAKTPELEQVQKSAAVLMVIATEVEQLQRELSEVMEQLNESLRERLLARSAALEAGFQGGSLPDIIRTLAARNHSYATPDRNAIIEECEAAIANAPVDKARCRTLVLPEQAWEEAMDYCGDVVRALKESAAPQDGGKQNARPGPELAAAAPKLSEARRIEDAIVAARLDAFEAADMLGAIIASLKDRYGYEHTAFDDVLHYSARMVLAIMELDK